MFNIIIVCHPTYGGSGVIATELGLELAKRGCKVHFISYERPVRLSEYTENVFFHEIEIPNYSLLRYPPVTLSIAAKIVEVCENEGIDIIHVHYALPYSTAAYLAKQILKPKKNIKVITTLHGTDISLVGQDKSFLNIVRFNINESDCITCVSNYLKELTEKEFDPKKEIFVINNFVNHHIFKPKKEKKLFRENNEKIIIHLSNFRPYKNVLAVIKIFEKILKKIPSKLILIGEGVETSNAREYVKNKNLINAVKFLGNQTYVETILCEGDLFIFPSKEESFGLALVESMSCGLPFVASDVGGIKEVVGNDLLKYLCPADDIEGMYKISLDILLNDKIRDKLSKIVRKRVIENFSIEKKTDEYLKLYNNILNA